MLWLFSFFHLSFQDLIATPDCLSGFCTSKVAYTFRVEASVPEDITGRIEHVLAHVE